MKFILPILLVVFTSCDSGKKKQWNEKLESSEKTAKSRDTLSVCCYQFNPGLMYEVDSNIREEFEISRRCDKVEGSFNRGACDKRQTLKDGYCSIKEEVRFFYNNKSFTSEKAKAHCDSQGKSSWIEG